MRILVVSNLDPPDVLGGYEVACAQVVDALTARGHTVGVLTSVPRQPAPRAPGVVRRLRLSDEWNAASLGAFPVRHLMVHARSRFVDATNVDELLRHLDAFQPEVVYLCSLIGIGGLALVATLQHRAIPWVWQLGDCLPTRLCSGRRGPIPALVGEFNRRIEGSYIAVSSRVIQEIEASGLLLRGRVELIPNWIVGTPRGSTETPRTPARPLRIMSAGSVNRDKGVDILIQALALLRAEGVDEVTLDVFGPIGDPSLVERVTELSLRDRIRFHGPLPHADLMERYAKFDVFAFPTQEREPFGLVPLEAASRGCVPVLTRRCGVGEWLVHGVHGLKVERTAPAFATALRSLATGEVPLEPLARRARAAAWHDFHIDRILPRIEAALRTEANAPRRRPTMSPQDVLRLARLAEALADGFVEESARGDTAVMRTPHHLARLREARA